MRKDGDRGVGGEGKERKRKLKRKSRDTRRKVSNEEKRSSIAKKEKCQR